MAIVVVGAAIIRDGRLLAAQRSEPLRLRGRWELPGGKVDPGESDEVALVRECREELGVDVRLRARVGADWPLIRSGEDRPSSTAVLRVWTAELPSGAEPVAREHLELRWLRPSQLDDVPWVPSDLPIVRELRPLLAAARA